MLPPGVSGMIDFAGGRGGHQRMPTRGTGNCAISALVQAAGKFGTTARVMLWIYAANVPFSSPASPAAWSTPTTAPVAGRTLQAVGPNGEDGRNLATSADGPAVWRPLVENFLHSLGDVRGGASFCAVWCAETRCATGPVSPAVPGRILKFYLFDLTDN
jgi:hypothetical protein